MANAVGFEGANDRLLAPKGDEGCRDLEIMRSDHGVVSCWRLTKEELERVNETGVVWLWIAGKTHPPVYVAGDDFVKVGDRPSRAEPYIAPKIKGGQIDS